MTIPRRDFLAGAALGVCGITPLARALGPNTPPVAYDASSLILHGRREILICGEMHYSRSTRAMWPLLLQRSRQLGLNCVATYVFWGVHEPQEGVFDFAGENDLGHFLALCQAQGLNVFLRVGPYCCAEWNFGGFPAWLRDKPGIVFRTMNEPYLRCVESYFEKLASVIKPYLAANGGPVILIQVENEYANIAKRYGEAGQQYLRWIVDLSKRVGFSAVPTTTCEGGASGAIETANGQTIDQSRVDQIRATHPGTPVLWSELYPAWYQIWGGEHPQPHTPEAMATGILTFLGEGGSGWNYYMWHGGTNFARTSMYLQRTSYDFSAPLDEYGRETPLARYLAGLHSIVTKHQSILIEGRRERVVDPSGAVTVVWTRGSQRLRLVANPSTNAAVFESRTLPPQSARLLLGDTVLFDTATQPVIDEDAPWSVVAKPTGWMSFSEPLPAARQDSPVRNPQPVEQLLLTRDQSDYCWYSTTLHSEDDTLQAQLLIPYGGDLFYVFVDGRLVAQSQRPFYENRGPIVPESPEHPRTLANRHDNEHQDGYRHSYDLGTLATGPHRLDLLSASLGMIKGDWQIGYPMNLERKGIWEGVLVNGHSQEEWQMRPFLVGETLHLSAAGSPLASPWKPHTASAASPLTWYKANFQLSGAMLAADADFRLDALGLVKGLLYVNGLCAGRFWNIEAGSSGQPSQRFYHIPGSWLRRENTLVLFDEQSSSPLSVSLQYRPARPAREMVAASR